MVISLLWWTTTFIALDGQPAERCFTVWHTPFSLPRTPDQHANSSRSSRKWDSLCRMTYSSSLGCLQHLRLGEAEAVVATGAVVDTGEVAEVVEVVAAAPVLVEEAADAIDRIE